MKTLLLAALFFAGLNASAATINCMEKGSDAFICTKVIDTRKLETIDCFNMEDGFDFNHCSNLFIWDERGQKVPFDCTKAAGTNDPYILELCTNLPKPNSVEMVNCQGELQDAYEYYMCKAVNTNEQESIHKKLMHYGN